MEHKLVRYLTRQRGTGSAVIILAQWFETGPRATAQQPPRKSQNVGQLYQHVLASFPPVILPANLLGTSLGRSVEPSPGSVDVPSPQILREEVTRSG